MKDGETRSAYRKLVLKTQENSQAETREGDGRICKEMGHEERK